MLDKLVIHLKNIIFFKAVIYIIFVIILFTLMPIFKNDLVKSSQRRQKSYSFLEAATLKLESIVDFEDKIQTTNKMYRKLMSRSNDVACLNRTSLINNMNLLSKKHQLFEPIGIKISRNFNADKTLNTKGHIKINYYEVDINFTAPDYHKLLVICQELYQLLPKGAIVTSTNIRKIEALTPKIVDKLDIAKSPGLVDVKMQIQLREIVHEE